MATYNFILFFPKIFSNNVGDASPQAAFSGLIKTFENKQATPSGPSFDHCSMQTRQSELFLQV
jgi:hypothetical protein